MPMTRHPNACLPSHICRIQSYPGLSLSRMASVKRVVQRDDTEAEGLPTWYNAMRELASVHLCSRLGFPKLLNNEGFAKGVSVADVCRQPGVGVVQLLLPQVIAMCVVKGLIDLATGKVSVPACEPCCSGRGVLEEA